MKHKNGGEKKKILWIKFLFFSCVLCLLLFWVIIESIIEWHHHTQWTTLKLQIQIQLYTDPQVYWYKHKS